MIVVVFSPLADVSGRVCRWAGEIEGITSYYRGHQEVEWIRRSCCLFGAKSWGFSEKGKDSGKGTWVCNVKYARCLAQAVTCAQCG